MPTFRGFIAIEVKSFPKLIEFENELKKSGAIIKLVEPENIHITLKFLGDTDSEFIDQIEEIIKKAVQNVKEFKITLKEVGVFPNQNYIKVIWIGINDKEKLSEISKKIDEGCSKIGFEKEKRRFSTHLTIGRVKSAKNKQNILKILEKYKDTVFGEVLVNKIILKKSELTSEGPIYTNIRDIKI